MWRYTRQRVAAKAEVKVIEKWLLEILAYVQYVNGLILNLMMKRVSITVHVYVKYMVYIQNMFCYIVDQTVVV